MTRINVLWAIDHLCYDGQLHGGGRLYWNLIPHFDNEKFNIIPCILRADQTIRDLFKDSPVPVRFLNKGKQDLTTLFTFMRLIRKENIHVMHLHCYGASTFGRMAGVLTGVPTIIHDFDSQVYFPYPWYLWLSDRLLSRMTRKAFAASPMVRDYMTEKRAIGPEKITMMFHAVPPEKYLPVAPGIVERKRRDLGLNPNDKVILTPTKVGPDRGNKYLLKAAKRVLEIRPKAFFVVVYKWTEFHRLPEGEFVDLSQIRSKEEAIGELQALAKDLGIDHRVAFIEGYDDLDELIAMSVLLVAPFMSERFSSVHLLEAMAKGKPIIATDMGEQREFIENGVNGYLVPPGDEEVLARRIQHVLQEGEELRRLSEQAAMASKRFSLDNYAKRLQDLYMDLASNSHLSGAD